MTVAGDTPTSGVGAGSEETKMNGMRNSLRFVLATTIVALALPVLAAGGKQFALSVQAFPVYTAPAGTPGAQIQAPVKIVASFTNLAPPSVASSNISSLSLSMTVPGMSIVNGFIGPIDYSPTGTSGNVVWTSPTSIQVTNMSPLKGQQTYALTLYVSSCGDTTWTGTANTGSQPNSGSPFTLQTPAGDPGLTTLVSCGTPDCVNEAMFSVVDTTIVSSTAFLHGIQSAFSKSGACTPVNYFVSNMLFFNGLVHFRWPVAGPGSQPTAVFAYDVTFTTAATPKVAWLNLDGSPAVASNGTDKPVFIDPLACASDILPAPYGTLSSSVSMGSNQIKVSPSVTPPATPFDIVIDLERMTVTSISGTTNWKVTRPVGGTSLAKHSAPAFVMSTPLPIFQTVPVSTLADGTDVTGSSPYLVGDQALSCQTGATVDNGDGTFTTPFIDSGDIYIRPH